MNQDNDYWEKGFLEGDENVLRELYNACFAKIKFYVINNKGTEQDAEDVFQQTYITVFTKLSEGPLNLTGTFIGYYIGVAKNLWRNEYRKKYRSELTIEDENTLIDETSIELIILEAEQRKLYEKQFKELDDKCQQLINFRFNGVSYEEIARILKYASESTAKVMKHKCQKQLIKLIKNDPGYKNLRYLY